MPHICTPIDLEVEEDIGYTRLHEVEEDIGYPRLRRK